MTHELVMTSSDHRFVPLTTALDADAAFTALVSQYHPVVFRWAVAFAGDIDDAEDIAQEVFVRVHSKLATFRGDGSFDGWLYRITRRVAFRARRRASRVSAVSGAEVEVYLTDPGARIDRVRATELIRELVTFLPIRQREVFVLCDLEGRTPLEVAQMIGIKDVSVRASLFKARAMIRRTMLARHPRYLEHLA